MSKGTLRPALLFAGLCMGGGPARAQAPAAVTVSVDATVPGTALERVWPFHGYDEANYTTTAEGRDLLTTLVRLHSAPTYVRTHFLLNTGNGTPSLKWGSTNVYTEGAAGNPLYSWTLMDGIMDTITSVGAFPFVEIAFMPQALSVRPNPYMNSGVYILDGGSFYPPNDYAKWGALIREWVTHANGRYPNVESSWQWELWNEPDIGYWHGTPAEYNRLYDTTEAAVHQVLPRATFGGPATASAGGFFTQFLQHCATGTNAVTGTAGTRLDLISFHAKGGVQLVGNRVQMNLGMQMRLHQTGFTAVAAIPAYRQTPIVVSEADPDGCAACPVSMTPADAYRNSPAYGAYEVAMMKKSLELEARLGVNLRGLLTWAFTFPSTPYFAGYRALTTNGIHLPVLNAFKLLGGLQGTRLALTSTGARSLDEILTGSVRQQADIDGMASLDGDRQRIQVLVWNYHDDLVAAAATPVHLAIKVPASFGSSPRLSHVRVDETHGDAHTVWVAQGSPTPPNDTQIAALRAAMEPVALESSRPAAVTGGTVSLDFDLPRFGISLVTIEGTAPVGPDGGAAGGTSGGTGGASGSAGGATGGSGGAGPGAGGSGLANGSGGGGQGGATPGAGETGSGGCACAVAGAPPEFLLGALGAVLIGLLLLHRTRRK